MRDPKVILPEGFDVAAAWAECHRWVDQHEPGSMAGAAGADPGGTSCPACQTSYWCWGKVIECECGFQFPTDWWHVYSKGWHDGESVRQGCEVSGGMRYRMDNPYYHYGFVTTARVDYLDIAQVDWKSAVSDWDPTLLPVLSRHDLCERCGGDKDAAMTGQTGLCSECTKATRCRHFCGVVEKTCKAGVNFKELAGSEVGYGNRLPCRYSARSRNVVLCDKFNPVTQEELDADAKSMADAIERMVIVAPLVGKIKKEHKGKSWSGALECPVCKGRLQVSHAAYNGHVHGKCETKDCLSWME